MTPSYDQIWDELYKSGHNNKYPWDAVVSFVFRNRPKNKPFSEIKILEIGCGTASNLQFAAEEGFQAFGVDASYLAISLARERLAKKGLEAELLVADFVSLPFPDNYFDLVIDRASLTHTGFDNAKMAISEVHRVLKSGGRFICTPCSQKHTSFENSEVDSNGLSTNISLGNLVGVGQVCFWNFAQIKKIFYTPNWCVLSAEHIHSEDFNIKTHREIFAEWKIIVEKKG